MGIAFHVFIELGIAVGGGSQSTDLNSSKAPSHAGASAVGHAVSLPCFLHEQIHTEWGWRAGVRPAGLRALGAPVRTGLQAPCPAPSSPSCRPDAFQVVALDGVSSGVLQFPSTQEHAGWLRAVSANISDLTLQTVSTASHPLLMHGDN